MPDPIVHTLIAAKAAIKLEAAGMRHSSGRSVRARYAKRYGLPRNAPTNAVLLEIIAELEELTSAPLAPHRFEPNLNACGAGAPCVICGGSRDDDHLK